MCVLDQSLFSAPVEGVLIGHHLLYPLPEINYSKYLHLGLIYNYMIIIQYQFKCTFSCALSRFSNGIIFIVFTKMMQS